MKKNTLEQLSSFIYNRFTHDATGHDYYHMKRVAITGKRLALQEGADPVVCEIAGWLHDVMDPKLTDDPDRERQVIIDLLRSMYVSSEVQDQIFIAMENVSFKTGHQVPTSLEGRIVQDADRLDAMGAIGVARAFAYGGAKGQAIHNETSEKTTIQHFYEKLLTLQSLLNTDSARKIGQQRHDFLKSYLDQFYEEWECKN